MNSDSIQQITPMLLMNKTLSLYWGNTCILKNWHSNKTEFRSGVYLSMWSDFSFWKTESEPINSMPQERCQQEWDSPFLPVKHLNEREQCCCLLPFHLGLCVKQEEQSVRLENHPLAYIITLKVTVKDSERAKKHQTVLALEVKHDRKKETLFCFSHSLLFTLCQAVVEKRMNPQLMKEQIQ